MNCLPVINAVWIGKELGPLSRCCLRSFVMRGHTVVLYTYDEIIDVPEDVIVKDAREILSEGKIVKHRKTGSYALFSDIFRYELLKQVDDSNIYVDCDVYCIKPLTIPDSGYLLGYEDDRQVNGAVLAIPSESPLLAYLLKAAHDSKFIPPWYSNTKKIKLLVKKKLRLNKGIEDMPWGVIGPTAITYYSKKIGIIDLIKPMDVFYPIHYEQVVGLLTDYRLDVSDLVTHRTVCIHLYNEKLRGVDVTQAPKGSVLNKMLKNAI